MSEQWKTDGSGGDDDVQMPLGVSGDGPSKEESFAEPKARMNASTLGLFAAFGAALIALYLLGLQNKPRGASAEVVAKQEATLQSINEIINDQRSGQKIEDLLHDTKRLVWILMKYLEPKQADGWVPDNVFGEVAREKPEKPGEPPAPVPVDDPELLAFSTEFKSLKLQAVMMGQTPRAMINGKIVEVGSKFKLLSVKEILPNGVVLTSGKGDYQLRMNAPSIEKE